MDMEEIWSIPLADVASNWRQFSYRDPQGATYTVDLVQLRIFDNLVEATGRSGTCPEQPQGTESWLWGVMIGEGLKLQV
jgi:hypothetical protein